MNSFNIFSSICAENCFLFHEKNYPKKIGGNRAGCSMKKCMTLYTYVPMTHLWYKKYSIIVQRRIENTQGCYYPCKTDPQGCNKATQQTEIPSAIAAYKMSCLSGLITGLFLQNGIHCIVHRVLADFFSRSLSCPIDNVVIGEACRALYVERYLLKWKIPKWS